jgi:hypothetical protein
VSARRTRWLAAALGAATVLVLYGRLLDPRRVLYARDVPQFHLALRAAFARLAEWGLPEWNPWLHGGQPVLSNPNYAAFYPPTWLFLALRPTWAIGLLVVLHAALGWAGAWRLARRLGGEAPAAALAGIALVVGGAFVSLLHAYTLLFALAWLPWLLERIETALAAPTFRAALGPLVGAACCFALQLLNGEPVTVLLSALAVGTWSLFGPGRFGARLGRAAVALAMGALVGAVQLVPALERLASSPRAGGLPYAVATRWSLPPVRLLDLALPRLFGDPMHDGFYFGWGIQDMDFPYLPSLFPGTLVLVLGLAALAAWPIPRRATWRILAVAGLLLALGRFDPLYRLAYGVLPGIASVRYPEKFALLFELALLFAAASGWQHLVARRRAGDHGAFDLPLVLALLVAGIALATAGLLTFRPSFARWMVEAHSGLPPLPEDLALGMAFLRRQAWIAVGFALATTAVLFAGRLRRPRELALAGAALLLLAGELLYYHRSMVITFPAAAYDEPPALARAALARGGRVFSMLQFDRQPDYVLRVGAGDFEARQKVLRLDPETGLLWGLGYALEADFDLMLTPAGERALHLFESQLGDATRTTRLLEAWNVRTVLLRASPEDLVQTIRETGRPPVPTRVATNPAPLALERFVPRAEAFADFAQATRAAVASGLQLAEREFLVAPDSLAGRYDEAAAVLASEDRGARIALRVRAGAPALLVLARTYDPWWSARDLDAAPDAPAELPIYETAAGQMALVVPAGERRLELAYRDPWVRVGAAITAAALLALAVALRRAAIARRTIAAP